MNKSTTLNVLVADSAFTLNDAGESGGAIVLTNTGNISVIESMFNQNEAGSSLTGDTDGGAIFATVTLIDYQAQFPVLNITSSTFDGNVASAQALHGESINGNGGGVGARQIGPVFISNSRFSNNSCSGSGGGVYLDQVGLLGAGQVSNVGGNFTNNDFIDNEASNGGGFTLLDSFERYLFDNNTFIANSATNGQAGGLFIVRTTNTILPNNVFTMNSPNNATIVTD